MGADSWTERSEVSDRLKDERMGEFVGVKGLKD